MLTDDQKKFLITLLQQYQSDCPQYKEVNHLDNNTHRVMVERIIAALSQ
jgi:hypothetical protein